MRFISLVIQVTIPECPNVNANPSGVLTPIILLYKSLQFKIIILNAILKEIENLDLRQKL